MQNTSEAVRNGPDPMVPISVPIRSRRQENHDTFSIEIDAETETGSFPFRPGQFNMLYVFGVGEIPISISGNPGDPGTLIHTTRMVGPVTNAMASLKAGDYLGVRGPFGSHWPVEVCDKKDVVLVAGGIGLAPLRPAIHALLSERHRFQKLVFLYGARTPDDILYRKEIERWKAQLDTEVFVTVDRAMPGWRGRIGVVPHLVRHAPFDPRNTVAFVCGPEIMMRYTATELKNRGISEDQIYMSMERNMKCAIGHCGHCQFGPTFVCKDGPVFPMSKIGPLLSTAEI